MTDAPERITAWVNADGSTQFEGGTLFPAGVGVQYIRADLAKPKVKPLVWEEGGDPKEQFFQAITDVGAWIVWEVHGYVYGHWPFDINCKTCYVSIEEAKSAAQADYERRILAALE